MRKLLGVMNMLITLIAMMVSQAYTFIKMYQIIYFKYVQFIVCQSYLNKAVHNFIMTYCYGHKNR